MKLKITPELLKKCFDIVMQEIGDKTNHAIYTSVVASPKMLDFFGLEFTRLNPRQTVILTKLIKTGMILEREINKIP